MKFSSPVSIEWMADFVGATLVNRSNAEVTGINEIHKVESGDVVFVDHPKYYDTCLNSAATFILINQNVACPEGKALLIVDNPFESYCKIVDHFYTTPSPETSVPETSAIGPHTKIFPNVYVGSGVVIGDHCIIHPNVTILDNCIIGDHVIIQSGTVIGSDAFYYNGKKNRDLWYQKMPSCGRVIIEDHVEIGANCTIDRGVSHDTRIEKGCKFDNLIHIGHDTVIGKNCLFAAQVVVGGCVTIEEGVTIWGQVAVNKTLTIGSHATILGKSGVVSSLEGNKTYWGVPVQEAGVKKKELVWIKRIPILWEKIMKQSIQDT